MRIGIERLRVWLLASAGLLLVVIAGFVGTARYLRRHWLGIVPARLGASVTIDSSGITKSFTNRGQTYMVVHAGRYLEHKDGKVGLRDVWIKLCGHEQKRADMVRGDEWEWDQKAGVIRALGVAHIELRAAIGKPGCAAVDDAAAAEAAGAKTMRATTSNLIYIQKLGVAATSAPIEFESGTMRGHAVGADYASDTGTLMLHSAVSMTGMSAGQPVEVDAASAEMDSQERVVRMTGARYAAGMGDAARTATAVQAVLHLRADQTLERIEAQGNVTMHAGAGTVTSAKAVIAMNAAGHPASALLTGGMRYVADGPLVQRRGEAEQATIAFDGKASPQAQDAVFMGAVRLMERTRACADCSTWNTRELAAAKVDAALAPDAAGKSEVRDAEATGSAKFNEMNAGTGASGAGTTEIAADDLKAHFAAAGGAGSRAQLETISGRGHTLVRQVNAVGVEETSAGDALDARFRPGAEGLAKKTGANGGPASDAVSVDALASAVQTGHVAVTRKDAAKSVKGGGNEEHATAQQAAYDGDTDRVTLTGSVRLAETDGQLWANEVVMERATGNAQATGGVTAEYAPQLANGPQRSSGGGGAGSVHVLAERADRDHATDTVTFHGRPARMWQAGSQVEAPVIAMERASKRLLAHGETARAQGVPQVRTVLTSADGAEAGPGKTASAAAPTCAASVNDGPSAAAAQQVVRVTSGGLVYSDALSEADFTGGLRAETGDGTIRAAFGAAFLKKKTGADSAPGAPSFAGSVDRMVASGGVAIDRPEMRATGERLVYTAADRSLLLIGDAKSPPRAVDGRGNVTTGAALKFQPACDGAGGDTVEVLNRVPGAQGRPAGGVHTEVSVDAKGEQPKR